MRPPAGPSLEFRVLGPLQVSRDGVPVVLGGQQQRLVLAVLLAARGHHVGVDRLLEEAWSEPPDSGRRTLAAHISRLRTVLDPDDTTGVLRYAADGYVLRTDGGDVDAEQFRNLLLRARTCPPTGRLPLLDQALQLWHGSAFEGLSTVSSDAQRRQLEELRTGARVDRAEARLLCGESERAVDDLEPLVLEDPLREPAVRLLAVALQRCGRTDAALDLLSGLRVRLLEDFGLDPGVDITVLEEQLRTTVVSAPHITHPPAEPARRPLPPRPLSRLIGRDALLIDLRRRLRGSRVLTLVGPAGTGKSRLALELAHAMTDALCGWVALEDLSDASLVDAAVAQALGVAVEPGRSVRDGVVGALAGREALLVLDDAEAVRDGAADVAAGLLSQCPALRIVTTSREPLGVPGEQLLAVPPLSVTGGAVELFLDRSRDVQPGWEPDAEDLAAVQRICAELDGLPLALELAAARTRTLEPAEIAVALSTRPDLLAAAGGEPASRHRTLHAALRWSYDLLPPNEQTQFRALAVFEGGFDLGGARGLLGPEGLSAVAGLVRRSMLDVDRRGPDWRYRMLTPLRAFALELGDPGERRQWQRRHLHWVSTLAAEAAGQLRGPDAAGWLGRLEVERSNVRGAVRTALALGDAGSALSICADLSWFWYRKGLPDEGVRVLRAALESAHPHQPGRGRAHLGLSLLQYLQGNLRGGLDSVFEAIELLSATEEAGALATAEGTAAWLLALSGDLSGARAHAERSLDLARRSSAAGTESETLMVLGQIARFDRGPQEAERLLLESVRLASVAGHYWVAASSGWIAAKLALATGDANLALDRARPAVVQLARDGDLPALLALTLLTAASLARCGRGEEAARLAAAGATQGARIGFDVARMDPIDSGWLLAAVAEGTDGPTRQRAAAEVVRWSLPDLTRALLTSLGTS